MFVPSNTSFLNPAEAIWSNMKRIFRYKLAALRLVKKDLRRPDLLDTAEKSMREITDEVGYNIYHAATGEIIKFLQERVD